MIIKRLCRSLFGCRQLCGILKNLVSFKKLVETRTAKEKSYIAGGFSDSFPLGVENEL